MSTILNTNGAELPIPTVVRGVDFHCAVLTAEWNPDITHALRKGAVETLLSAGVAEENITCLDVPGTVELVNAAAACARTGRYDAVIVIGCVIRGDTPHFDYVCMHTANGIAAINAQGKTPIIFGVLTVNELSQAEDRAGGVLGNKGSEAAVAAIAMSNLHQTLKK